MGELGAAISKAFSLVFSLDPGLYEIVFRSLEVSLTAVFLAALAGLPAGAFLALRRFPFRNTLVVLLNACMGLPPVVIGLLVYLLLSHSGPLGILDLLFTPGAMILAQAILVAPILAALTRQVVEDLWGEYDEQLRSLGAGPSDAMWTLLWDGRFRLVTVVLAGFGRAIAEVGAVLIVGGNIEHATRVMTTAIALETSKGDLSLALALGMILIAIAIAVNVLAQVTKAVGERWPLRRPAEAAG